MDGSDPHLTTPVGHGATLARRVAIAAVLAALFVGGLFGALVLRAYRSVQRGEINLAQYDRRQQFTVASQAESASASVLRAELETGDDPAIGPDNARVTIVEFGDFECPFTQRSVAVVKDLIKKYGSKIRFIYRDFPNSSLHEHAMAAAVAAGCADEQRRFWQYHDLLFLQQDRLADENLLQYASDAGLDVTAFRACLQDGQRRAEVEADYREGLRFGVSGTPTWFINGRRVEGALPYDVMKKIVDYGLKGKL